MTSNGYKIFDGYAEDYDVALARGLSVSGEEKEFFAQRRIEWLRDCLKDYTAPVASLMDFGCGTGSSSQLFFDILGIEHFVGTDQSPKSLEVARREHGSKRAEFFCLMNINPVANLIWCFATGFFIIFLQLTVRMRSIIFYDRCARADCSPFGKTILGIPALVM